MSPDGCRKIKAIAMILMLGVAEAERIRSGIRLAKASDEADRHTASPLGELSESSKKGKQALSASLLAFNPATEGFNLPVGARHRVSARSGAAGMSMRPSKRDMVSSTAAALALASAMPKSALAASTPWSTGTFLEALKNGNVEKVSFGADGKSLLTIDTDGNQHDVIILPTQAAEITAELQKKDVPFTVQASQNKDLLGTIPSLVTSSFFNALPFILIGGLILAARSAGGDGGMGDPGQGMGKSRSKIQMDPETGVTFNDVAGCDGAKMELVEVVDFLKDPSKYSALGAKIPKGVVMEGPPGTGKTLLARAVAGEAGVPFIGASASEFVEMFVGVGASRVRDLFSQAKRNAPCIVFMDEIDAIGKQRSGGGGDGGSSEREATLNQILTEMDGFEGNTGVIVIAATNRADTLDTALVRPGRFDRRVPVDLPDVKGRLAILGVHSRGKPLAPDTDMQVVAKRTTGFSGASLANLMNEAAIVAARNGKTQISYEEIDYAIDRITVGMQKQTGMTFPARLRLVAYHEAGHAIMGLLAPEYDMVTKVTIIPRTSGAGGFTLFTPPEERLESGMYTYSYLCTQLAVALGGRVAEEIVYGEEEITTGASNDLQQVRSIARRMVAQWGFANEAMGSAPIAWEQTEGNTEMNSRTTSEPTERAIDENVKKIVNEAYDITLKTLRDNREFMDKLAEKLIEDETVDYQELEKMRDQYGVATMSA